MKHRNRFGNVCGTFSLCQDKPLWWAIPTGLIKLAIKFLRMLLGMILSMILQGAVLRFPEIKSLYFAKFQSRIIHMEHHGTTNKKSATHVSACSGHILQSKLFQLKRTFGWQWTGPVKQSPSQHLATDSQVPRRHPLTCISGRGKVYVSKMVPPE